MALVTYNPLYEYQPIERVDTPQGRRYWVSKDKTVPSVTTILSATKDASHLEGWKKRVGEAEAERIKTEAAYVGTAMHHILEFLLLGEEDVVNYPEDNLQLLGCEMAFRLARTYFHNIDEHWGAEVPLYYPERYAGTSDLVGVWKGKPAIIDFKQSLKPKRKDWIIDYYHQLAAYACAHDKEHGTNINFGVILIACQTGETQEFTTTGSEFERYKEQWMERVEKFYALSVESNGNSL
ncbi:hypothetical protein EBT31_09135 [bacterium]|nr:hypothetical protein [bacterium]